MISTWSLAAPPPCLDSPRILDLGDINFLESKNLCHPNLGSRGVFNLRGHPGYRVQKKCFACVIRGAFGKIHGKTFIFLKVESDPRFQLWKS